MRLEEAVAEAVKLLRAKIPEDEILQLLTALGTSRVAASEILAFLPIVYARELLRRSGCANFSSNYSRRLPESKKVSPPIPLARKPAWRACESFLRGDIASGSKGDDLLMIAARSAEFQAAHEMLNAGTEVQDLVFKTLLLDLPEEGPIDDLS